MRVQDSLQAGRSRFFAEVTKVRALLDIANRKSGPPLLFLLDELLHGTNSHDRRQGAAAVLQALLERGAIGEAGRARHAVLSKGPGAAMTSPPLAEGTLAAYAVPLNACDGSLLGVAAFGSRSAHDVPADELLAVRVAAARAAHALECMHIQEQLDDAKEAARRTSAFHDQILAIVGHDLRNPLGAVVMSAALLRKRGGLEGWQARTVDRVRASAARMGRIISDLLSYTRTRLGTGIPIARAPTDLGDVTARMVDELRAAHPEAKIHVHVESDVTGDWDADRLEQVVSNVVSNAIDHGEEDAPIHVRLRSDADTARLEVENRGEMPPAVLAHAFEAFQRGPESTGKKASGLGLGLYIAREIVRRHGGDIAVHSGDGATRVVLTLPRSPAAEASPQAQSRTPSG
jgi:signal transduction histidine kinase